MLTLTNILTRVRSLVLGESRADGAFSASRRLLLGATAALALASLGLPTPADATLTISTASRQNMATALLADISGGTIKLYNGSKPAALGTPAGTLLATLNLGAPAGTATNGVITIGSVTQTNTSHVNGTPTFIRFSDSGGTAVADIDIGAGAGNVQFSGTVVNGQNVTVTGLTLTMPNA
jgi:hypothetical protein